MDQLQRPRPVQPTRLLPPPDVVSPRSQSRSAGQSNGFFQLSFFLENAGVQAAQLTLAKSPNSILCDPRRPNVNRT